MMREEWRKLEKESYLKVGSGKSNSCKKTVNIKTSDMIKKRPEGEESTADEADVSDTEKVILKFVFSKKATKIDEIFTVDLTLCSK